MRKIGGVCHPPDKPDGSPSIRFFFWCYNRYMLEKISEHVYRRKQEPDTDRPHLYLIVNGNRSIAIDAGNSAAHVHSFYKDMEDKLPLPSMTIITHAHWDHTYGLHAISGTSLSSQKTADKLKQMSSWKWSEEAMEERLNSGEEIAFCAECMKLEYPDLSQIKVVPPVETFTGEHDVDLNGLAIHLKEVANPHEVDGTLVIVDDLVILGDASSPDYYHLDGLYDESRLEAFIQLLKEYPEYRFCHSHIDEIMTLEEYLDALKDEADKTGYIK